MKYLFPFFIYVILSQNTFAQAPQGIPYQAVARNSSGTIIASQLIKVRFTIHDNTASGTVVYQETFNPTTNSLGLFNVNVGTGTIVTGTFNGIAWGVNAKFMQVEMDPTGGTAYVDMGTQQMMSVPYALYAVSSGGGTLPTGTSVGDMLYWNGSAWVRVPGGITTQTLTYCHGVPQWGPCLPLVITNPVTDITPPSALGGGNVLNIGSSAVTNRGICWNTSPEPTIALTTKTSSGSGLGAFSDNLFYLSSGTTYYVRAFATSSVGTAYGNELTFTAASLTIGASFGGGKIAYILLPGDPGYIAGETHGLIAAPSNQSSNALLGCIGTLVGGTSTSLGTGAANTAAIISVCGGDIAAEMCYTLVLGGYSDWYLPSKAELNKLYINKTAIGGFTASPAAYASSSEDGINDFWTQNFDVGTQHASSKSSDLFVRAVRTF